MDGWLFKDLPQRHPSGRRDDSNLTRAKHLDDEEESNPTKLAKPIAKYTKDKDKKKPDVLPVTLEESNSSRTPTTITTVMEPRQPGPEQPEHVPTHYQEIQNLENVHSRVSFQPSTLFFQLGLSIQATPLMDLCTRSTYLLVQNNTGEDILIPKTTTLGWLISIEFQDPALRIPVIRQIPLPLLLHQPEKQVVYTKPSRSSHSDLPMESETVSHVNLTNNYEMVLQTMYALSADTTP